MIKSQENFNSIEYCKHTCEKSNNRNRFQHLLCAFKSLPEMFKRHNVVSYELFPQKECLKGSFN